MKALITGGHGFIGGHLARQLHQEGHDVRVVDIARCPPHGALGDGEVIIGNLCDPVVCAKAVDGVDIVFHFAATMGGMGTIHKGNDFIIFKENLAMAVNLLEASVRAGVKRFFYASSACVYPGTLQETNVDVALAEEDVWKNPPPSPQHLYGLEKLVSEMLLTQYASETFQIRIARFHNIFGPVGSWCCGREKAPAALLRKAVAAKLIGESPARFEIWGDGQQRRSFCYIDDTLDAVLKLVESDCSDPVNIGSDRAVSVQELARLALDAVGLDHELVSFECKEGRPVGVGSRNSDNTFVKKQLGWSPARSLEEGMKITGEWIERRVRTIMESMDSVERMNYLRGLGTSQVVDLGAEAITFAILLPITSRGSTSPQDCLKNLECFAQSLAQTTADDIARLGERYQVRIYLAIDKDDDFLWTSKGNKAEPILVQHGFHHVITLPPCSHPRGHICALWRDCALQAFEDRCDYYVLMGDDVEIQDPNWMSAVHHKFLKISEAEGVPQGIGCVAFSDISFPGFPTFPVISRVHMEIFGGNVIPECFINQDGDPFLFQLYRRWGCSKMISSRLSNGRGGGGEARYDKAHAAGWSLDPLDDATNQVVTWIHHRAPDVQRKLTLDVIIPCYRVNMSYLGVFLALRSSPTCSVNFIVIVDDPRSPNIGQLLQKYSHRVDVRIRVNSHNLGVSASRNRGLKESCAEWVHFLDDDVTPDTDILVEAENAIRAHPNAAGFICNAKFPSADTMFTAAVHLSGVTYFWDIAEKISRDVPWGVTANIIVRRNVPDGVEFELQFPKTGGGEDIDYCRKKREFSLAHGREPFLAAPNVRVTHPWWNNGRRTYWRFYMWSKGDGRLVKLYPDLTYRDFSPNAAECLLLCGLALAFGFCAAPFDFVLSMVLTQLAVLAAVSVLIANVAHDILRHIVLHSDRVQTMKTTVTGARWLGAVVESALIRVFSEWGRVVGVVERREFSLLLRRFDWFCGVYGDLPMREEKKNNRARLAMALATFAALVKIAF